MNKQDLVRTLQQLEFDKHNAHRWLLRRRQARDQILARAGLLALFETPESPFLLGTIERGEVTYDWGCVVFNGAAPGLDQDQACSVYAAFEHCIRRGQFFPMFISLADLQSSSDQGSQVLPVFGLHFDLHSVEPGARRTAVQRMLKLHQIHPRQTLLVDEVVEVSDAALFETYFQQSPAASADSDEADKEADIGPSLDTIDIWHT